MLKALFFPVCLMLPRTMAGFVMAMSVASVLVFLNVSEVELPRSPAEVDQASGPPKAYGWPIYCYIEYPGKYMLDFDAAPISVWASPVLFAINVLICIFLGIVLVKCTDAIAIKGIVLFLSGIGDSIGEH